jgi:uncharacterized cupredoxin-like copper-binding protein
MTDWGAAGIVFAAFLVVLIAGFVLAAWTLARPVPSGPSARDILDERLARGEISPEEYIARRDALRAHTPGRARRHLGVLAAVLVAAGLAGSLSAAAAADFGDMGSFDMRGMMGGDGDGSAATAPAPIPGAREITVVANEFSFEPNEIRIRTGERVNIEMDNRGDALHTLVISKLDFKLRANGGKRAGGALTVEVPGRYPFTCDVPGHAEAGMRGTLVAEPAT